MMNFLCIFLQTPEHNIYKVSRNGKIYTNHPIYSLTFFIYTILGE